MIPLVCLAAWEIYHLGRHRRELFILRDLLISFIS